MKPRKPTGKKCGLKIGVSINLLQLAVALNTNPNLSIYEAMSFCSSDAAIATSKISD